MLASMSSLALGLFVLRAAADYNGCYAPDGTSMADNATYVPCNKLGIYSSGVHSSCCLLDGEESDRDICLTSGLCQNAKRGTTRGYCTDPTWSSDACVHVCLEPNKGGSSTGISKIQTCGDTTYSCGSDVTYCGTNEAVTIPTQASVISSEKVDAAEASRSTYKKATIGLAVVLGVLALAAVAAVLVLMKQNKSLKRKAVTEKPEQIMTTTAPDQDPPPPESYVSASPPPHNSQFNQSQYDPYAGQHNQSPYGSQKPADASHYSGHNMGSYSELDGATVARNEMGSPGSQYDRGPT